MSVICFGELIIDFTSREAGKPLWQVERFQKNVGGAPANVAIGLHHHRVPVRLWSRVGDDSFGKFLVDRLNSYGISTQGVVQDIEHPTKLAFVGLDKKGERHFEFHNQNSAEGFMQASDYALDEMMRARIFHFGGVALLGDTTANTLMELLRLAKQRNVLISFDPNIRMDLVKNPEVIFGRLNEILNFADILKLSKDDWTHFFPNKSAEDILGKGIALLVLTEGAKGVRLKTEKIDVFVPVRKVKAVDTTGAGDAFTAAFLSKIIHSKTDNLKNVSADQLREWGEFANHWASNIVQYPGAVTGYFESK
jgi:fructokinase